MSNSSTDLFEALIENWNSADYEIPITDFHGYESVEGETWPRLSPREVFNMAYGAGMTGRKFSQFLMTRGMTLAAIAKLQNMRFNVDGIELVGRDIIFKMGVNPSIVQTMTERVNESIGHKKTIVTNQFGEIKYWESETGKRTYKGEEYDGAAHYKNFSRQPKEYKRNRKVR